MAHYLTDPVLPTEQDASLARAAWHALEQMYAAEKTLSLRVGTTAKDAATLELPSAAAKLLLQLLDEMGKGHAITVVPTDAEITTQQAADLLNVSRPYVIGLIEKGDLPVRMVGNQRRMPLAER